MKIKNDALNQIGFSCMVRRRNPSVNITEGKTSETALRHGMHRDINPAIFDRIMLFVYNITYQPP